MKNKSQIIYDKESSVLSIEVGRGKSVESDVQGNAVIDYDKKGGIVRVNLYGFRFDDFRNSLGALKTFSRQTGVFIAARR